ncbi:MAG: aquaporin family protein [Deltaproteobacteria bacterium]|nr:MAG: aquaporin family protein [Deltaproteobacteria bacterium]
MPENLIPSYLRYLIEAALAASLMLAVSTYNVLLEHPASPAYQALDSPIVRRGLMGLMMGTTIALFIASPWGKRSGAHFNPAVSAAFFALGKMSRDDFIGYVLAQLVGACAAMLVLVNLAGDWLAHPRINFVATRVGPQGLLWAFAAEFGLSLLLMLAVLCFSARPALAPYVPLLAGSVVAVFVLVASPLSGMSMNPARSLGSAIVGGGMRHFWLYCVAPIGGMLSAARLCRRLGFDG